MTDDLNLRWVETFAYKAGQPIKLMPTGTFKRGPRTFTITRTDLEQMAANYDTGRPRWKVPLYFGHPTKENMDPPKAGNIAKVYVAEDDKGKPALFGVPEYTDDALRAVEGGTYQYVSPGVLWSKNGSAYSDEAGRAHDNVLEHVALTNRPFFGEHTAVFSADDAAEDSGEAAITETMADNSDAHLRARTTAMDELAAIGEHITKIAKGGWTMSLPAHKRPQVEIDIDTAETDEPVAETASATDQGQALDQAKGTGMENETQAETLSVPAEEFAALKAQADAADAAKARNAELEAEIAAFKREARMAQLRAEAETFSALPLPTNELADKLYALETKDADLYGYFVGALKTANSLAAAQGHQEQKVVENAEGQVPVETFSAALDNIITDEFKGDLSRTVEAMRLAAERYPDLAEKYASTGR